ncbi:type II secretion system minor pseudopilin GspJ [Pseudaeromonas paramecii]|uniref:Type II secretion system protein J n=1 Tax=Pseudaeromonas paramecii TaxID=2138166 RepID=A0ABP8QGB8_9GAMM
MSINNHQPAKGFTLLEVLLAIAIFASMSLAAYQVLQGVLRNDEVTRTQVSRMGEVQRAFAVLARDFQQAVPRPVRVSGEASTEVIRVNAAELQSEGDAVAFVHTGWLNPGAQLPRSNLQWVGFRLMEGKLQRLSYLFPDPVIGTEPQEASLLSRVTGFKLRYWQNRWLESWSDTSRLPTGIEVTLELEDYGSIRRVFTLVESGS